MEAKTNYIGNSRWTNSSKSHAVHIAPENGLPICGKIYKGCLDRYDFKIEEVTCKKCLSIYNKNN